MLTLDFLWLERTPLGDPPPLLLVQMTVAQHHLSWVDPLAISGLKLQELMGEFES